MEKIIKCKECKDTGILQTETSFCCGADMDNGICAECKEYAEGENYECECDCLTTNMDAKQPA